MRVSICFGLLKPWWNPSTQRARYSGVPLGWISGSAGSADAAGSGIAVGTAVGLAAGDPAARGPEGTLQPIETISRRDASPPSPRLRDMRRLCLGAEDVGSCRCAEGAVAGGRGNLSGRLAHDQAPDMVA